MMDRNRRSKVKVAVKLCVAFAVLISLIAACGKASYTPPTSSTVTTPPLSASPTTAAPDAKIEVPQDQDMVDVNNSVGGTSVGVVGSSYKIWVVVLPIGTGRFHPQNPAAVVISDGRWNAGNVVIGLPDESGLKFAIYAVVATEAASAEFQRYFTEHEKTGDFPGLPTLPNDMTPTHGITVTRK